MSREDIEKSIGIKKETVILPHYREEYEKLKKKLDKMFLYCPVCGDKLFELFDEELDDNGDLLLRADGYCANCHFEYVKRSMNKPRRNYGKNHWKPNHYPWTSGIIKIKEIANEDGTVTMVNTSKKKMAKK